MKRVFNFETLTEFPFQVLFSFNLEDAPFSRETHLCLLGGKFSKKLKIFNGEASVECAKSFTPFIYINMKYFLNKKIYIFF